MEIKVPMGYSLRVRGQIVDRTVTPATGFKPTTLKWSLWDKDKQEAGVASIINSRKDVSALATCDASGNWTIDLTTTDMALQDANKQGETHIMLIFWTYNTTSDYGEETVRMTVTRTTVPAT